MRLSRMHALLLDEIEGRTFRPLLQEISNNHPAFAAYPSWGDVARALNAGRLPQPAADALLAPLIAAYAGSGDGRWSTILCASSFRWLVASHARRAGWHDDPDEVWQELVLTFLDVCRRAAARSCGERVRHHLICQTQHRLHDAFARRWRLEGPEVAAAPGDLPKREDPRAEPRHLDARLDLLDLQERGESAYRVHHDAGTIDALDLDILVGTRLHGHTVADVAARLGITFDRAKKRRQRAEAAIRAALPAEAS